jgi:hypothetical protein
VAEVAGGGACVSIYGCLGKVVGGCNSTLLNTK